MWELLMEEAWLRGELEAPGFRKYQWEYCRTKWITPGWKSVDPKKEAEGQEIRYRMRTTTRADICAEEGNDWEEIAEQAAREAQKDMELGLGNIKPKEPGGSDDDADADTEEE
jgi:capsid protein